MDKARKLRTRRNNKNVKAILRINKIFIKIMEKQQQ
jgi:hypothetical protein